MYTSIFMYYLAAPIFLILSIVFFKNITKYTFWFYLLAFIYIVNLCGNVFFPIYTNPEIITSGEYPKYFCSIIPFEGFIKNLYKSSASLKIYFNICLKNLILLIPAGFIITAVFKKLKSQIITFGAVAVLIELIRLLIGITFNTPSYKPILAENIIFYIIGEFIGFLIYTLLLKLIRRNVGRSKITDYFSMAFSYIKEPCKKDIE